MLRWSALLIAGLITGCGMGGDDGSADLSEGGEGGAARDLAVARDLSAAAHDLSAESGDLTKGPADLSESAGDAGPPGGDAGLAGACNMATPIVLMNNTATVMGDTTGAMNDTDSGNCGGITGPDVVYTLALNAPSEVIAKVTPGDMKYDPVIYLRKNCVDDLSEQACDEVGLGQPASVDAVLQPGTYFLWIDGYLGTKGKFQLDVTVMPPPPPPANDSCMSAAQLTFVNGTAGATGDLRTAMDDAMSSCANVAGADAVYTFTTNDVYALNAVVTVDQATPKLQPVLYVRKVCASNMKADEVICRVGQAGAGAAVSLLNLSPGTYWIWVDSLGPGGKYKLDVTLSLPPMNDGCGMPEPLVFNNGAASANLDTTAAANDTTSPVCGGNNGPDVVYTFTTQMPQSITATVTPDMVTPNFDPVIYVRKACGDVNAMNEVACNEQGPGKPASIMAPFLAAGTYFVWVDGLGGSRGKGKLDVTLGQAILPPTNDNYTMPLALNFVNGVATAMIDTTYAKPDTKSAGCGGDGNDVVFTFTTMAEKTITAKVVPDMASPSYDPVVYIRDLCSDATLLHELACDEVGPGKAATATAFGAGPGTYFVWVDGYSGSKGKSVLTVTLQ
jgi:hypothetical protein